MAEAEVKETENLNGEEEDIGGVAEPPGEGATSGSSSDSDADGAREEHHVEALESILAENPTNYDAHVQYVQCLRKLGDIEKLRSARRSMNEMFPLSPNMWQEWAKDEISLTGGSDVLAIEGIYERGVGEYLSVPLWLDYLNFSQEHDQSVAQCAPAGLAKMRGLFERALTAAGLHVTEGNKIWDAYREFEQAIYLTIDESNSEERKNQLTRVRSLFHRQLAIPLVDLKSLMVSYKFWECEQGNIIEGDADDLSGIPVNIASVFKKALEMYNDRAPYEDQLSKQDASALDKLQILMSYIKMEESLQDPIRVQMLYERAVSEFPISNDLWTGYTRYLDKKLKVSSVLKNVYFRATRNCPWDGDLWVHYMLSLERIHVSEQELSSVFEKSLQFTFTSADEYLRLFLTRIDGLRRRISSSVANEALEYRILRETFQRATDYLSPQLTRIEDLLLLYAYWARLEATLGKDLPAARGVWEKVIKQCGMEYDVWKFYIAMEIELGHTNDARSIFKRCYNKRFNGSGSEEVCHSWLRFEREYGSLDELDFATKKVTPRLEELKLFRAQQESENVVPSAVSKDIIELDKALKKRKTSKAISKQSPAKQQKSGQVNADESKESFGEAEIKSGRKADASTSTGTRGAEKPSKKRGRGSSSDENPMAYSDQCTAFVSNLDIKVNEEDLREFFNIDGGVAAIRLLRDKFTGRSRGLAYVDFMDEKHLSAAIMKNKQKLHGKKISVARSNPRKDKKRPSHRPGGLDPSESKDANDSFKGVDKELRSKESGVRADKDAGNSHRRAGHVQLSGRSTFAIPRSVVRPLGWNSNESKPAEEQPKSNAEFKEMLLKK